MIDRMNKFVELIEQQNDKVDEETENGSEI